MVRISSIVSGNRGVVWAPPFRKRRAEKAAAAVGEGAPFYCLRHLQEVRERMDEEDPIYHLFS